MNQKIKYIIFLIIGIITGVFLSATQLEKINEDIYWGQYKHGLSEGFEKGFLSGQDYGKGQVYAEFNITIPEKTTWYFNKGYNLTAYNIKRNDLNTYETQP